MKKILCTVVAMTCLGNVFAQENEEIKLSGFYLGSGVNVNYDMAKLYNREALLLNTGYVVPSDTKIAEMTDLSYGAHALLGYGYVFCNKTFLGIEQQVGIAHHPSRVKMLGQKIDGHVFKPLEFTTLARLGYKIQSCSGIAYVSAGMKVLTVDSKNDSKSICRPVFGIGYQHGLSQHFSVRGDVLYTHISNVNIKEKVSGISVPYRCKGHRISAMVTLAYTL